MLGPFALLLVVAGCPKTPQPSAIAEAPAETPPMAVGETGGGGALGAVIGGALQHESTAPGDIAVDPEAEEVVQLVQRGARREVSLEVDDAAATLLGRAGWPSDGAPSEVFSGLRSDCEDLWWTSDSGYGSVAVPPPMIDDSEEQAATQQAAIDMLQETTEVSAWCNVTETYPCDEYYGPLEGETEEEARAAAEACEPETETFEVVLITIALHQVDGAWKVVGWRDFTSETGHNF